MFNNPYYAYPFYGGVSQGVGAGALSGAATRSGLGSFLRGATSRFSWDGFLTSTGKTLNVINQAIPIFYQVRPMIQNAKTMFRVLGAVREKDTDSKSNSVSVSSTAPKNTSPTSVEKRIPSTDGNPTFFL